MQENSSNKYRYCAKCQRPLPSSCEDTLCIQCRNQELFTQIRDYIRTHNVTERELAEHFNIPLHRIREWMREGRIAGLGKSTSSASSAFCVECGVPISFGRVCSNCRRAATASQRTPISDNPFQADLSRFKR